MDFNEYKEGQYLGIIDNQKVYVFSFVMVCDKSESKLPEPCVIDMNELFEQEILCSPPPEAKGEICQRKRKKK